MRNYFNYFTEIEEHFQQRRGSLLMLSTLDWVLIETWREAGLPLEVVLRGIDTTFDHFDARQRRAEVRGKGRLRRVNGLAWCAQSVLEAAEQAARASLAAPSDILAPSRPVETGFEADRVSHFLETNADLLRAITVAEPVVAAILAETSARLRTLAADRQPPRRSQDLAESSTSELFPSASPVADAALRGLTATPQGAEAPAAEEAALSRQGESLEDLDRTLSSLEERIVAVLQTATPEPELLALREQAAGELAPYRSRMGAVQVRQLQQQLLQKRLLARYQIPRLSLFYMDVG